MKQHKTNPFRYAVGMFGTSVPINMFKTYAAAFYVMGLGVTTGQLAKVLLIYTFLDMIDNPVYGFLSDKTHSRWGRRRLWLVIGTPLLILSFIAFFNVPPFIGPNSLFFYMLLTYMLTGTLDSLINANYAALFPELFGPMPSAQRRMRCAKPFSWWQWLSALRSRRSLRKKSATAKRLLSTDCLPARLFCTWRSDAKSRRSMMMR